MPSPVRFAEVRRMLEAAGYRLARISGSHHVFLKPGATPVTIPVHKGKVKPVYVRQIQKLGEPKEPPPPIREGNPEKGKGPGGAVPGDRQS